jgi:UrcA family protein
MSSFVKTDSKIVAALGAFIISSGIFAAVGSVCASERSVVVKFQDLNIATPEGAAALYGRIHTAAQSVCESVDRTLMNYAPEEKCVREAEANAVSKVNSPALTAYYERKTGQNPALVANLMP